MVDESSLELEPGEFLYQSDSELFLVTVREEEDSYFFAAHGWRKIDKERLEEYVEGEHGKLYTQDDLEQIMDDASDETVEHYERLQQIFQAYAGELEEEGPHTSFALDDT